MLLHRVLLISPFRCYNCDDRHFRFRFHSPTQRVPDTSGSL
jgi:hypothetical protein